MSNDTVTFILDGDEIGLGDFAKALSAFSRLLSALQESHPDGKDASWCVDSLSVGSTLATARCVAPPDTDLANRLVDLYEQAGRTYKLSGRSGISVRADNALDDIAAVINGQIQSVRLETANEDIEITEATRRKENVAEALAPPMEEAINSIAAVQGRVETIARHKGLRFTLYELHTDKTVSCYLAKGYEEIMREAWGRLVIVEGEARYDRAGRITTLRNVSEIDVVPEVTPEECLEVIGAYKPMVKEPPEVTIRRMRDA